MKDIRHATFRINVPIEFFGAHIHEVTVLIEVRSTALGMMYVYIEIITNGLRRWSYQNRHLAVTPSSTIVLLQ